MANEALCLEVKGEPQGACVSPVIWRVKGHRGCPYSPSKAACTLSLSMMCRLKDRPRKSWVSSLETSFWTPTNGQVTFTLWAPVFSPWSKVLASISQGCPSVCPSEILCGRTLETRLLEYRAVVPGKGTQSPFSRPPSNLDPSVLQKRFILSFKQIHTFVAKCFSPPSHSHPLKRKNQVPHIHSVVGREDSAEEEISTKQALWGPVPADGYKERGRIHLPPVP